MNAAVRGKEFGGGEWFRGAACGSGWMSNRAGCGVTTKTWFRARRRSAAA